jgi:hypothetical protein
MPQKTNLNVAPYYDDFTSSDNFVRTLFRPGFAIQARELTQLQSALQNQLESGFGHIFEEGTMIIPGQSTLQTGKDGLKYVKLNPSISGETVSLDQFVNADTPVILTGKTSGVKFAVTSVAASTTDDPPTLFGVYTQGNLQGKSAAEFVRSLIDTSPQALDAAGFEKFVVDEELTASVATQHGTTAFAIGDTCLKTAETETTTDGGLVTGNSTIATVSNGIYFVRGTFVEVLFQQVVVNKYEASATNARIGLQVVESIVTPETDSSLLDNSQGSSNFAAKGAHRLKMTLTLVSKALTDTDDSNFYELIRVKNDITEKYARVTEYSIIEEMVARRTFDESGNYTVRPFTFQAKESVDTSVGAIDFTGVYTAGSTTDDRNTASKDLLALQVSTGKAFVKGFEIEKIAPTILDLNKSRTFETVNAGVSSFDVGNFVNITNVYGTPDVSRITGESTAFKPVEIRDTFTATRGSSSGSKIGIARARSIQHSSGTAGETDATYRLYLFDLKLFTYVDISGTPSPTLTSVATNGGQRITGATSGATGFFFASGSSSTRLILSNVVGNFVKNENLILSDSAESDQIIENSSNADLTVTNVVTHTFDNVRSVFMSDDDSGQNFSADISLSSVKTTSSFISIDGTDAQGTDSADVIITEQEGLPVALNPAATGGSGSFVKRAVLQQIDKNTTLFKLPKSPVKTLLTATNNGASDTQFTIRKQFVATTNSSGAFTITAGANETFLSHTESDYTISILIGGTGTGKQGDIVSASTGFSGGGTSSLTITNNTVFGTNAKVKLMATLLKTSVIQKTKTTKLMKQLKVTSGATDAFGTRPSDKVISFGRTDAFRLMAVFEGIDSSTDAATPTVTLTNVNGTFTRGEKITGGTSKASARIINTSTPLSVVYTTGNRTFSANETITAESSGATATVSSVTVGDKNITTNFLFDSGQRDNFYDVSRIIRKASSPAPTGRLLIVYDYLEHSIGDVFTVDSYVDSANQMEYEDIPTYSGSKVDTEVNIKGEFALYDVFDFRPTVEDAAGTSTDVSVVDEVTGYSLDFFHRQYDGTGSSPSNFLKPASLVQADFEYYLPKRAILDLDPNGKFILTEGAPSEIARPPEGVSGTMRLADIFIPPFTFKPTDVIIRREKNQRFTMRDIGRLQNRIENLEYYTHLSLLERDAESFEIIDANGLNRFKSGFVVDAFQGHRLGDVAHPDYNCSIDQQLNELRPKSKNKDVTLIEKVTTDTARAGAGYQKTGDLVTLPYNEETFIEQTYATRVERVTPVLLSNWAGKISLSPSGDNWFEVEVAPDLIINVEGNFDSILAANRDAIGTIWNAWQTQWSGVISSRDMGVRVGNFGFGGQIGDGVDVVRRTQERVRETRSRTGIRTDVIERVDEESLGTRVISRALLPFCRANTITFEAVGMLPNTQVYPFFDRQTVEAFTQPELGFSTNDASLVNGDAIITNPAGRVRGVFNLPDPKIAGNPTFRTGEVSFRLTSSPTNITSTDPITAAETIYHANGILETEQETIIATRNAEVIRTNVSESTTTTSVGTNIRNLSRQEIDDDEDLGRSFEVGEDPLSQTFMVNESGGTFITSVDIFFQSKDEALPVTVEIRTVVNGYPGAKLLPFGRVTLEPSSVNISEDAQTATNFKFPSPIYLQEGFEYCMCIITNVPTYKVWIARMGETELQSTLTSASVGGTATATNNQLFSERTVSEQPNIGVLFKGHNNRTWAPSLLEDLKFNLKRARFTALTGTLPLVNDVTPVRLLQENPLIFQDGSNVVQVNHRDHQMHSTANNVTLANVKSGATTTLAAAITNDATSITLSDGTNFDDTSGKFSRDASNNYFIKIGDEIITYAAISGNEITSATRGTNSTTAVSHDAGATVELFMLHKVPFTEINKTHTAVGNVGIDSYTITVTTSAVVDGTSSTRTQGGGESVTATENILYDLAQFAISNMTVSGTKVVAKKQNTTGTSPSGSQTSFVKTSATNSKTIQLNENVYYEAPNIVASAINEQNEMFSEKSLELSLELSTTNALLSPVVDTERMTVYAIANRINNIDSSSDVFPTSDFTASTEPDGDNNVAVYCTRRTTLAQPATALKVFFAANRDGAADIKVLYKILRVDDEREFDDIGWRFFNEDKTVPGLPDVETNPSLGREDFQEYLYTGGVTDDGLGDPLDEFSSFAIKIVMQTTNSAEPPRIKDLRAIALAT